MNRLLVAVMLLLLGTPVWGVNDPMRPPFFDGSTSKDPRPVVRPLRLSMVLFGNDRKVAVLNGHTVKVGDTVMGYRVLRIERDHIVVSKKGRIKEVSLGNPQQRGKTQVNNIKEGSR